MNRDKFLEQLAGDLAPVRPRWRPFSLSLLSLLAALGISVLISALGFHFRADLRDKFVDPFFLSFLAVCLLVAASSFAYAFSLAVPGKAETRLLGAGASFVLAGLTVFSILQAFLHRETDFPSGLDSHGFACTLAVAFCAFASALPVAWLGRGGAPSHPGKMGAALAGGALSCGIIAVGLHCPVDNEIHIALYHLLLPALGGGVSGTFVGLRLFRW
jgi:hypothetical protein